ncbi:MAG: metallophosphoesterase family protein [Candidatus Aceula meridiana]|nr:metallophosphoesterase family protein [Candidatus Aceula meridiana]
MRYGIFADVHGNLEALEAVIAAYKKESIDKYFFCGDVVGYGANPSECIERIKSLNAVCIAGNHDRVAIEKRDIEKLNIYAKEAMLWTKENISQGDKDFLDSLDLVFQDNDFVMVHGTLSDPERFDYLRNFFQATQIFELIETLVCFVGHSHAPAIFVEKAYSGDPFKERGVQLNAGCRYIVNAGSVGQPRDGDPKAAYVIFDTQKKIIEIKRVAYDIKSAQDKILKAGFPKKLAERLVEGN